MTEENAWPRLGDKLFDNNGDWWNACVGLSHEKWHGYVEGYKSAADLLVQHIGDSYSKQDYLIYPIVFLFRQAIEVALKRLLFKGSSLLDRKTVIPKQHRLVPLWQQCRTIIEKVWSGGPKQDLDAVSEVLKQFDAKDPVSTVFRYPLDTAGQASIHDGEHIDIRNFADVANRVFVLLDCCDCGFSEYLDRKSEMEREYYYGY